MKIGEFKSQVNAVGQIFHSVSISDSIGNTPRYPQGLASACRNKSYLEVWEYLYGNHLYDYLLYDFSFVQFRPGDDFPNSFSYAYYECPYDAQTYDEFVLDNVDGIDESRSALWEEYELYLATQPPRNAVTPIRYDYSPKLYAEGIHPASHVHFGFNNTIRVGTKKVMKPISFALFILRHVYPALWIKLLKNASSVNWCRNVRDSLDDVSAQYFQAKDHFEKILF